MTAINYPIDIEQGATWSTPFALQDSAGVARTGLTGYVAKFQIRSSLGEELPVIETVPAFDSATATITVTLTAAQTSLLTRPKYIYGLELAAALGEPTDRIAQGPVTVSPDPVK